MSQSNESVRRDVLEDAMSAFDTGTISIRHDPHRAGRFHTLDDELALRL